MKLFVLLAGLGLLNGCAGKVKMEPNDHFDGRRFYHSYGEEPKSFWTFLKWKFQGGAADWPKRVDGESKAFDRPTPPPATLEVTFINHASAYLRKDGLSLITDPQWSERASPVSFAGPKRVRPPGILIESLPSLDVVLVSHNHYDHLDTKTLRRLKELYDPIFLVALGDGELLRDEGITKIKEMDWYQSTEIRGVKLTFTPVKHWSARGLFDRNESLWGGFVIEWPEYRVYFAGDTGYCSAFKDTREKFGPIDFALLPIGAYEPRWFMKDSHMNPEEAVQAHLDLGTPYSMGIHMGLWQLTNEAIDTPVRELAEARRKLGVQESAFFVLEPGETRIFSSSTTQH